MQVEVHIPGDHSPEEITRAITEVQPLVQSRRFFGTLGVPSDNRIRLADISHVITRLNEERGKVLAEVETLDTLNGKLLDKGVSIRWVASGLSPVLSLSGIHAT